MRTGPAALLACCTWAAAALCACSQGEDLQTGYRTVSTASGVGGVGHGGATGEGGSAPGAGGAGGASASGGSPEQGGAGGQAGNAGAIEQGGGAGAGGEEVDGGAGLAGGGAAGLAGSAGAAGCTSTDPEPNNDIASAQDKGDITDCDSDGASLAGTADGAADEDWYSLHGEDTWSCQVDPTVSITASEATSLCVYFLCDSGDTTVSCYGASQPASTVMGDKGCCTPAMSMSPGVECSGSDDSAQVWVQVKTTAEACVAYSVGYHY